MNAHLETPIPLTILNQAMREDFRGTVVKRALDHLDQAGDPTRRGFARRTEWTPHRCNH
jgi:hypothetical protein